MALGGWPLMGRRAGHLFAFSNDIFDNACGGSWIRVFTDLAASVVEHRQQMTMIISAA
jgi:hypothetical protein